MGVDQMGDPASGTGPAAAPRFAPGPGSPIRGGLGLARDAFADASGAIETALAADRLIAWATAVKYRAFSRLADTIAGEFGPRRECQPERFDGAEVHALAATEIATATAVSESAAARQLDDAIDLCTTQRAVLGALEEGQISDAHARIILDAARSVPAEDAPHFARAALLRAATRTGRRRAPGELRTVLRRMRERVHPETIATRKHAALKERGVWFTPNPDGMCTLEAHLPAEAGLAIYNGLDTAARTARASGAPETLDQLRADALAARLLGAGTGPDEPFPAFRPEVIVTIPVHTLLGEGAARAGEPLHPGEQPHLGEHPGDLTQAGDLTQERELTQAADLRQGADWSLAELAGYGPIDTSTARQLAALAQNWQRLYTDATTGTALGVGRTAYRPPKALRRYLAHRDGTCRFPGCTRPADRCEPDHTTEWQDGGTTDPHNLAFLCRKHHALKSIGAWTYTHTRDGNLRWRSPLGRTHHTEPAQHTEPARYERSTYPVRSVKPTRPSESPPAPSPPAPRARFNGSVSEGGPPPF
ncbi:DUF222 domain-containing protein [Sinomonas sp. ASV322]|uniref:HNH endonuclease signature motif containing protein n=1 Tax=Sinomonas sp. ASV322 TaxID=3041920 RepID=UPI0027DCC6B7|nr:DUF222 domain-containing protein [Sinomonas sp. ASV322]MDQ4502689.1 DUF222 domain-containing protein [Sinomonas sp. ASV322]